MTRLVFIVAMVDRQKSVLCSFLLLLLLFDPTFELNETLSLSAERDALLELRSSLGLKSKDWPIKGDPCTQWRGVQCENGRVVRLNISGFRRTRIGMRNPQFAVDGLANLTSLTSFNASRFFLPGDIPNWLGRRMMSLQVLDLSSCSIGGVIHSSLGNLTNLTGLYLADNHLVGSIPLSLGQLLRLSVLDLARNLLTGPIHGLFGGFINLSRLDVSSNFLSGSIPLRIGTLKKLQYLNLSNNNLSSSIPGQLGDIRSLVELDLSFNYLSGPVPKELRSLRNLQKLILGNNFLEGTLSDKMFPAPSQLHVVVLRHNNFTGSIPNVLWSMPRLHMLDVSSNKFTGQLPEISLNASASNAVLNISDNNLYGVLTPLLLKFSFIDLYQNYFEGNVPQYARYNASLNRNCLRNMTRQRTLEECKSFYDERGLAFDSFGHPLVQTPITETHGNNSKKDVMLGAVFGGLGFIVLVSAMLLFIVSKRKKLTKNQRSIGVELVGHVPTEGGPPPSTLAVNVSTVGDTYTYQQLLQATNEFSDANLIKHGHSGDIFKGILENEVTVVIKRIDLRTVKKEKHLQELDFLSNVFHIRLVPLLGRCFGNENEKFLVYKYMPNGDLSSSLYRKRALEEDGLLESLDWITRLKIATGAAEVLAYLHHECTPPLVHRDVQASSILLDDKFEVRLGSLSEISVHGTTQQNVISRLLRMPQSSEHNTSGLSRATCAYDVYCFGKVLLELVTGKLGISSSSDAQIKEWLEQTLPNISTHNKESVTYIVDPSLIVDDDLLEEVWAMAIVAKACLNRKASRRPIMKHIFMALENPLKVVRGGNNGSARLSVSSSRGSWSANLFSSWRQNSSSLSSYRGASTPRGEAGSSFHRSGTFDSQGSGQNVENISRLYRRHSNPELSDIPDAERSQDED